MTLVYRRSNGNCMTLPITVVIGGGLRLPPKGLTLFERVVNIVHKALPGTAIAFNTKPEDTADAAARQIGNG